MFVLFLKIEGTTSPFNKTPLKRVVPSFFHLFLHQSMPSIFPLRVLVSSTSLSMARQLPRALKHPGTWATWVFTRDIFVTMCVYTCICFYIYSIPELEQKTLIVHAFSKKDVLPLHGIHISPSSNQILGALHGFAGSQAMQLAARFHSPQSFCTTEPLLDD